MQSAFLTNLTGNNVTPGTLARGGTNAGDFQLSGDSCSNTLVRNQGHLWRERHVCPGLRRQRNEERDALSLPTGVAPTTSIALTGDATEYISLAPAPKDFGSTQVATPTGATQFTATNAGPGTSGTMAVTLSGANASEFGITQDNCTGHALTFPGNCTVSVRFAPTSVGAKSATLNITGTTGGTQTSALTGTATAPPPPPPPTTTTTPPATKKKCKKAKKGASSAKKKCKKKK